MSKSRYEDDEVQHARLFILGLKGTPEDAYRKAFEQFGVIRDVYLMKDRKTREDKGIVYIKFSKASEAALAMEEMNGKPLDGHPRPLKVMMASEKGSGKEPHEDEKMLRLFVVCPKSADEEQLKKEFEQFGEIDIVTVQRDKSTGKNRGFAYIKYYRAYHAALALEGCDSSYRPKFAEPRRSREERMRLEQKDNFSSSYGSSRLFDNYSSGYGSLNSGSSHGRSGLASTRPSTARPSPFDFLSNYPNNGCSELQVIIPQPVTQEQLGRLFDIVPGLEYVEIDRYSGHGRVFFNNPMSAAYAIDKLNNLEYPPGSRLVVRYLEDSTYGRSSTGFGQSSSYSPMAGGSAVQSQMATAQRGLQDAMGGPNIQGNIKELLDSIQKATSVLTAAGLASGSDLSAPKAPSHYNIPLPDPKPMAPIDAPTAQRLFIVCQYGNLPDYVLKDIFCRFGDLIDVYILTGKSCGFAKFASVGAAEDCIRTLHGQEIAGARMKISEADPPREGEPPFKRRR